MTPIFNYTLLAICAILLLVAISYFRKKVKQNKAVSLKPVWILGITFFLLGLGVQALNMSEIYSNICCGPDTEEIAQQVKQALLYRYGYYFLTVVALIAWFFLKRIQKHQVHYSINAEP